MAKPSKSQRIALEVSRELFRAWGREGGKKGAKARWTKTGSSSPTA